MQWNENPINENVYGIETKLSKYNIMFKHKILSRSFWCQELASEIVDKEIERS